MTKKYDGAPLFFDPSRTFDGSGMSNAVAKPLTREDFDRARESILRQMRDERLVPRERTITMGPLVYAEYERRGWIKDGHLTDAYVTAAADEIRKEADARGISVEDLICEDAGDGA